MGCVSASTKTVASSACSGWGFFCLCAGVAGDGAYQVVPDARAGPATSPAIPSTTRSARSRRVPRWAPKWYWNTAQRLAVVGAGRAAARDPVALLREPIWIGADAQPINPVPPPWRMHDTVPLHPLQAWCGSASPPCVSSATLHALSNFLVQGLADVSRQQPEAWRCILLRHNEALPGAALCDERLFVLLTEHVRVPTSQGDLLAQQLPARGAVHVIAG